MPDAADSPLSIAPEGFANPLAGIGDMAASFDLKTVASVMLALMFAFWALYTLVAVYHLIRYGHQSWLTVPAIGIHLFVSVSLAFFAISGLAS